METCKRLVLTMRALALASLCGTALACDEEESGPREGTMAGDCTDQADNDGDGNFDCSDEGCWGSPACPGTVAPEGGEGGEGDEGGEGGEGGESGEGASYLCTSTIQCGEESAMATDEACRPSFQPPEVLEQDAEEACMDASGCLCETTCSYVGPLGVGVTCSCTGTGC